jgi:hypothetical protein
MANISMKPVHAREAGVSFLYGKVVLGAAGAIDNQSCKGFSVAKTGSEVGRYTITFPDSWEALLGAGVALVGAADAAWGSAGSIWFLRNVSTKTAKTIDVQFATADASPADAELPTGTEFYINLTLKNTTAW